MCRPLDAAGIMDTMHESHTGQLLPRLEAGDAVLARFAEHCLDCKVRTLRNHAMSDWASPQCVMGRQASDAHSLVAEMEGGSAAWC